MVEAPRTAAKWTVEPRAPHVRRFGGATHVGPPWVAKDKDNEDFVFYLEMPVDDEPWVLAGVADGVSSATWSARGARHASAAFIETFDWFCRQASFPRTEEQLKERAWGPLMAREYHRSVRERLEADRRFLLEGRHIDPSWSPDFYTRKYLSGPQGLSDTEAWFQSTLLAVALGPNGGFALLLGDGFVRVDRRYGDGSWECARSIEAQTRPGHVVSLSLTQAEVFACLARLAPRGAAEIGVLLATDGVSNSTEEGLERAFAGLGVHEATGAGHPLDRVVLKSSHECRGALERLAALPKELIDPDNMSLAFAARALGDGRLR